MSMVMSLTQCLWQNEYRMHAPILCLALVISEGGGGWEMEDGAAGVDDMRLPQIDPGSAADSDSRTLLLVPRHGTR